MRRGSQYAWSIRVPINTNTYHYIVIHCNTYQYIAKIPLKFIRIHTNTLQYIPKYMQIRIGRAENPCGEPKKKYIPNTLQYMAIHGNTLQYMAFNTYQYIAIHTKIHSNTFQYVLVGPKTRVADRKKNTYQIHCNTWQYMAIHCNTWHLIHTNTLQYIPKYMQIHSNTYWSGRKPVRRTQQKYISNTWQYISIHGNTYINT